MISILKKNIKNVKYKSYLTGSSFLSNSLSNPIPNSISNSSSFISTSSSSSLLLSKQATQIKQSYKWNSIKYFQRYNSSTTTSDKINTTASDKNNTTSDNLDTSSTTKEKISSPPSPPPKKSKWGRIFLLTSSMGIATILFIKLDQKYSNSPQQEFNDGSSLLSLKTGGPKMLKIASHLNDDENKKPKLVILGSGWGAISLIKELEKDKYHVTVISPQNYFLFTPLLPSATVGTLESRSLMEPIRSIIKDLDAHFLEAAATAVCFNDKLVEVAPLTSNSNNGGEEKEMKSFYVPYDKLVIAVGSQSITHGIEGIQYCHSLKTINDARTIRKKIMDNFELASLPTTTLEERKQLLSFVVCGGGPTGVEFAAELYDFLTEDLVSYFPAALRKEVQVSIIQSSDHILNTYDKRISDFAEKKFERDNINVITNARVQKIEKDHVLYKMKNTNEEKELKYGLCLWSTGISMIPFAEKISSELPEQKNKRALITDNRLRLKGIKDSSVYAIGDCSTIENPKLVEGLMKFFMDADLNNDGALAYDEFSKLVKKISKSYPITSNHLRKANDLFEEFDKDKSGTLELNELRDMLENIDKKLTSLPATAQVAHQQGKYLGKKFNQLALAKSTPSNPDLDDKLDPFNYAHLGSLAYIGNAAVADFGMGYTWMGGWSAVYLWRSIYFSEQVSFRTRALIFSDWTKRFVFGRDISKF
ncbi:hypothetical protein Glove_709g64 [Diversispora epigaea]|uniref:EF-hand domain-containing protein n=1 Tax=Diversispora epigaea TaxID=1348612 RepID=A0A397G1A4_9GLOM|nr:hypothetical protein Glove_709g64 [Diversispora epigaea]